jgi:hypothetical protein
VSYGLRLFALVMVAAGCQPATLMMAEQPDLGSSSLPDLAEAQEGDLAQGDFAQEPQPDLATGPTLTTLRIHYPVNGKSMALRGDTAPLDWGKA